MGTDGTGTNSHRLGLSPTWSPFQSFTSLSSAAASRGCCVTLSLTLPTAWKALGGRHKGNRITATFGYITLGLLQLLDDVPVLFCHFFQPETHREAGLARK